MAIKIKPGDMVRHRGEIARVMELDTGASDFRFRLAHFGWIGNQAANRLELVESIPNTTVTIEGYTFQTYHLEPVNNYDII